MRSPIASDPLPPAARQRATGLPLLFATLCFLTSGLIAAENVVTTNDLSVPLDHLRWLVKPMTQSELVLEANAWQRLLRVKVEEIAAAEIAVKRQNDQIKKATGAANALKQAKQAADEAKEAEDKAMTNGVSEDTTAKIEEARKRAVEAEKALAAAKEAEDKAAQDSASKNAEIKAVEKAEAKEVQAQIDAGQSTNAPPGTNSALTNATVSEVATNLLSTDTSALDSVAEKAASVADVKAEVKKRVLADLADLRTDRSRLVERFNVVVNELKAKGGKVEEYEKYRDAATADLVDVKDTSAVWAFISGWVKSDEGGKKWAINAGIFVTVLVVFLFLGRIVGAGATKVTRGSRKMSGLLKEFMVTAVERLAIFIGILVALSFIGVPIGPLLALLSAAGFVVGFALQGTLSNFASGLLILFYRPFDVGDWIEAGGVAGKVTAMNLMSTRFTTGDNKRMIVPNNAIWGGTITNATGLKTRRVDLVFGISYGDSIEQALEILERVVAEDTRVLKDPKPLIRTNELADSSVNFICRPWVKTEDYWETYWSLTRRVKEEFDREGITIPFPQRDVHVHQTPGQ